MASAKRPRLQLSTDEVVAELFADYDSGDEDLTEMSEDDVDDVEIEDSDTEVPMSQDSQDQMSQPVPLGPQPSQPTGVQPPQPLGPQPFPVFPQQAAPVQPPQQLGPQPYPAFSQQQAPVQPPQQLGPQPYPVFPQQQAPVQPPQQLGPQPYPVFPQQQAPVQPPQQLGPQPPQQQQAPQPTRRLRPVQRQLQQLRQADPTNQPGPPQARNLGQPRNPPQQDPHQGAYRDPLWLKAFNERSRPLLHDPEATPFEIFSDLLPQEAIDLMVRETNRYAEQYFERIGGKDNLSDSARAKAWKAIDEADMRAFLGLILLMGQIRLPTYSMYWSTNPLINLGMRKVMSRDRFLLLLSFFHCADNATQLPRHHPLYDRLYKCREVTDTCISAWKEAFQLGREVSVDETVIGFCGRASFVTYNPNKPHKWGMTVWTLADSRKGYVYDWNIYTGKKNTEDPRTKNKDGRGAVHWVTWDLLEGSKVLDLGHHVYMDNYFSSPVLYDDLAKRSTGACGTLRRNRVQIPEIIKRAKPTKAEGAVTSKAKEATYFAWMDRSMVTLISTIHTEATMVKTTRSKKSNTGFQQRVKPKAIELYTKYMGGVDLADQAMWYNLNLHKSTKWWKKVVFAMLEVCFTNSLTIYRLLHPEKKIDRNKYRLSIITDMIDGYSKRSYQAQIVPAPDLEEARLNRTLQHFPELIPSVKADGKQSYQDCEVCSDRFKVRHTTCYRCMTCEVPLCPAPCFLRFHTMRNGWKKACGIKDGNKWKIDKIGFHGPNV